MRDRFAVPLLLPMLLLLTLSSTSADAGDWPAWRGADGSGISGETGLPIQWSETEHVLWKVPPPGTLQLNAHHLG